MLTKHKLLFAVAMLLAILSSSCGKQEALSEVSYKGRELAMDARPAVASAPLGRLAQDSAASFNPASGSEAKLPDATSGRKLVYLASMDIEAAELREAEAYLDDAVQAAGGYVSSRTADANSVFMQIRIPVAQLESLMAAVAGQGRVLGRSLNAEDVTDQYFDLEGRLRNKRLLEARYREYLGEAASLEEILQVERSLSEVSNEIEWLEGSFRDLGKRIDLATLSVTIQSVYSTDASKPTLGQSLRRLMGGFGEAIRVFLVILAGLLLYGIPSILILAGLWWLAFGRLGLVRRLFALVSKAKSRTDSRP